MTTDDQGTDMGQVPESRTDAFAGGRAGGGPGVHIATAIPVQQADPSFNPASSVLLAANQYSGVGLGSSDATMRVSNAYGVMMRDQLKQSGSGKVQ
jgi:hypothetical protein